MNTLKHRLSNQFLYIMGHSFFLPLIVHPVTAVQLPLASHTTCAGEAVPSYPVAQAAFEVPRYVVAEVPVKSKPVSVGVLQS